jgi:56kDa selenium binding protein (SBP56)
MPTLTIKRMHDPLNLRLKLLLCIASLVALAACRPTPSPPKSDYLFVWAGDSAEKASDFLAVIDANPASAKYGSVVTTLPTGAVGTHPHHTEAEMPANGHLLANGFHAGRTWLFDLTEPTRPKILTEFGNRAGYSHPHTFVRLSNGNVLATYQYKVDSSAAVHEMGTMKMGAEHATGGLVEMDERGMVVRSGSAVDDAIADKRIYPYSVVEIRALDRAVSTTTDMDSKDTVSTAEWMQIWRLSDLKLLKSIALKPGPRGDEQKFTGEPHLLPDGKSVYIHTFNCGMYLVRGLESASPTATFVKGFQGTDCGVPILTGHWWLQPVPEAHALLALDITDPEHPREVSSVSLGADVGPHWIAINPSGRRVVLTAGGWSSREGNRLYVIDFDPATGMLAIDSRFKDPGSARPGIAMTGRTWPHGFTGTAVPHGTVFSR